MKKAIGVIAILVLSGCGYEGKIRYECQIPENWENKECNPPICLAEGQCTKDLIGFDPTQTTITVTQDTGD